LVNQASTLNCNHGVGGQIIAQGCDVYNGEETGETAATVTSATGIANASGPKAITFRTNQTSAQGPIHSNDGITDTLQKDHPPAVCSWNGDTTPKASEDVSVTLRSQQGGEGVGVAISENQRGELRASDVASTLGGSGGKPGQGYQAAVTENLTVRRLTPKECERLQSFPDDWTSERAELALEGNEWKATGKVVKQADGPRYKQMGNAVTVNVAKWLGERLSEAV
jgi:DNA (cytosine-5)-methyltransferase 1